MMMVGCGGYYEMKGRGRKHLRVGLSYIAVDDTLVTSRHVHENISDLLIPCLNCSLDDMSNIHIHA